MGLRKMFFHNEMESVRDSLDRKGMGRDSKPVTGQRVVGWGQGQSCGYRAGSDVGSQFHTVPLINRPPNGCLSVLKATLPQLIKPISIGCCLPNHSININTKSSQAQRCQNPQQTKHCSVPCHPSPFWMVLVPTSLNWASLVAWSLPHIWFCSAMLIFQLKHLAHTHRLSLRVSSLRRQVRTQVTLCHLLPGPQDLTLMVV